MSTRPCPTCLLPELPDYPHRHDRPPRAEYDPMPVRPERLYCGAFDVDEYWTGTGDPPDCCALHLIAYEYRAEVPTKLHPTDPVVATRAEPIPTTSDPDGPTIDVPDAGELGGWPWSSPAHRRFGGIVGRFGETTLDRRDYRVYPWALAIGPRLAGHCRRHHATKPDRWPEHREQAICSPVVRLVVERGFAPETIAMRSRIPPERLRVVLETSVSWIWRRVSETLNELELGRTG